MALSTPSKKANSDCSISVVSCNFILLELPRIKLVSNVVVPLKFARLLLAKFVILVLLKVVVPVKVFAPRIACSADAAVPTVTMALSTPFKKANSVCFIVGPEFNTKLLEAPRIKLPLNVALLENVFSPLMLSSTLLVLLTLSVIWVWIFLLAPFK